MYTNLIHANSQQIALYRMMSFNSECVKTVRRRFLTVSGSKTFHCFELICILCAKLPRNITLMFSWLEVDSSLSELKQWRSSTG